MINRWQGNSGRVQRLPEKDDRGYKNTQTIRPTPEAQRTPKPPAPRPQPKAGGLLSGLDGLKKLIPSKEALETEDIILLLILYLMYRESGDSELLMIMGAMFLL